MNYYSTNGACVPLSQTVSKLNNNVQYLQQQAINANNFALQYINATIYFQTQQGYINSTTPWSSNNWFSNYSNYVFYNFFVNKNNRATSLFKSAYVWIQSVFSNALLAVNPCFQAWASITNGGYCAATSNSSLSYQSNNLTSNLPLTLVVDPTSTGNYLNACAPLLDVYCSLTFGISTSNSALPFNTTFNWFDQGLLLQDCYNFRNQTNCTSCNATLNGLWINLFNSAWMKLVPSATAINNLGSFLTATVQASPNTFVPIPQAQNGVGFNLVASSGANGENVYLDGQKSGLSSVVYGGEFMMKVGLMILTVGLLV